MDKRWKPKRQPRWLFDIARTEIDWGQSPVINWNSFLSNIADLKYENVFLNTENFQLSCNSETFATLKEHFHLYGTFLTKLTQQFSQHIWLPPELYVRKKEKRKRMRDNATFQWEQKELSKELIKEWENQLTELNESSDGRAKGLPDPIMLRWLSTNLQPKKTFCLLLESFLNIPSALFNIIFDYYYFQARIEYWYADSSEIFAMDLDNGAAVILIHNHSGAIWSRFITYCEWNLFSWKRRCYEPWQLTPSTVFDLVWYELNVVSDRIKCGT